MCVNARTVTAGDTERGDEMALRIRPTPALDKKETVAFLKKVEKNLQKPPQKAETPNLRPAKELAARCALFKSK
jgi:hypothetical protein